MISSLFRVPISSAQVRRDVLLVTLLLMESCLAAAVFIPLNESTSRHSPLAALLGFTGLIALAHITTRLISRIDLSLTKQRLLMVGLIMLAALILTRFHVYSRFPPGCSQWLGEMAGEWAGLSHGLTDAPVAMAAVLFCWWRGIRLAYRDLTLESVSLSFRLGVLGIAGAGLLWKPTRALDVALLVYLFFFFAILSMGLARVDEIAGKKEGIAQPFGIGWLSIMIGSGLAVIGLGWLVTRLYSPEGFKMLADWLSPALRLFEQAAYALLMVLGRLLEPILTFLLDILEKLLTGLFEDLTETPIQDFSSPFATPMATDVAEGAFPWGTVLKWTIIGGMVLLALIGIALSLRKLDARRDDALTADRRALLGPSEWRDDLLGNLRAGAEKLVDLVSALGRHSPMMELYAMLTIRSIYAGMVRIAGRRGYPRRAATTPYEYLPQLRGAFPDANEMDLDRITDAYIGVHYGEIPSTLQEVQEIRQCWDRVRSRARPLDEDTSDAEQSTDPSR